MSDELKLKWNKTGHREYQSSNGEYMIKGFTCSLGTRWTVSTDDNNKVSKLEYFVDAKKAAQENWNIEFYRSKLITETTYTCDYCNSKYKEEAAAENCIKNCYLSGDDEDDCDHGNTIIRVDLDEDDEDNLDGVGLHELYVAVWCVDCDEEVVNYTADLESKNVQRRLLKFMKTNMGTGSKGFKKNK